MPKNLVRYLYPACVAAAAILGVAGFVVLWGAGSFERYITALLLFALVGVAVCGAREVKAKDSTAEPNGADGKEIGIT